MLKPKFKSSCHMQPLKMPLVFQWAAFSFPVDLSSRRLQESHRFIFKTGNKTLNLALLATNWFKNQYFSNSFIPIAENQSKSMLETITNRIKK